MGPQKGNERSCPVAVGAGDVISPGDSAGPQTIKGPWEKGIRVRVGGGIWAGPGSSLDHG